MKQSSQATIVFVGGAQRSGTTLLGTLLGSHDHGVCVPQSHFKTRILKRLRHDGAIHRETLLEELTRFFRFDLWELPPEKVRENLPETISSGNWFIKLSQLYAGARSDRKSPSLVVDHTPSNMRRARLLDDSFPDAKFIHIVRDGRAVANSVLPLSWGPKTILEAPDSWSRKVSLGIMAENQLSAKKIRRITFEELVEKPAQTLENICGFLEIDFQERMLEAAGFEVPDYSKDQHELVGRGVKADRAAAWKHEMSERHQELFEYYAEAWLDYLDYPLLFQPYPERPTRLERWKSYWKDLIRTPVDKIRYRLRRLKS